ATGAPAVVEGGHTGVVSPKERLVNQTLRQSADRVPTIGGWILGASNLANLARLDLTDSLCDPYKGVIRAHLNLGVDGMVSPVVPTSADQVRTGSVEESDFEGIEPEALLDAAERVPSERELLEQFDWEAEKGRFRLYFENAFSQWPGIEPLPNF